MQSELSLRTLFFSCPRGKECDFAGDARERKASQHHTPGHECSLVFKPEGICDLRFTSGSI